MNIWIGLYKGKGNLINSIVRRWTKSQYSHAELILNDRSTWIGISPFIKSKVTDRKDVEYNEDNWDFYKIPMTIEQYNSILEFYDITRGTRYDWIGMLLTQFLPFHIKQKNKWYCSEWILYALRISCVIDWKLIRIFDQSDLSPSKLHDILLVSNFKKSKLKQ